MLVRRVIPVVVLLAVLVVPVVPAGAKTTVKVKGDVVTITVPIDCVGCKDFVDPINGGNLAKYWEKTAEDAWNAAFDKYSYCNKYKFKLDIKMKNRPAGSASRFGPHELIATQPDGRGFTGAGWGGAPSSSTGGPEGQRVPDGTRYYEFDAQGSMPADATPTVIEHEFGHVIGLGDDRDDAGNPVGPDPKGIMVGGANGVTPNTKLTIGKNHVDRIGDQLANLGEITCGQAWKGTVEQKWQGVSCTSTASSQAQFIVKDDDRGKFEVALAFAETASDCPFTTANLWGSGSFAGRLTRNRFAIEGGPPLTGSVARSDDRINGSYTNPLPADPRQTYTTTWDLQCVKGCDQAAD